MLDSDTPTLLNQLRERWASEGLSIGRPATVEQIAAFTAHNSVAIPPSLHQYLVTVNGLAGDNMDGLARLWPLSEFRRVTDYLTLYQRYAPTCREAWTRGVPIHAPLKGGEQYLRLPPERAADDSIVRQPQWALPDADDYFVFGDYNIEGSYWALRLRDGAESSVITIYDYSNVYIPASSSFDEFLRIYVEESPDVLF